MKRQLAKPLKNAGIMSGIMVASYLICFLLTASDSQAVVSYSVEVLAVLLIARFTDGYLWGIIASLVAAILTNYAFTYPYYQFNLSLSGYLLTFLVNVTVSLVISVLNTQIKRNESVRLVAERERLRTDLFRAVSHDIRTPLTSIIGSTGAILENDLSTEKQRELISNVNNDAQWLVRMVENLLAVTRVSQNTHPLRLQTEVIEEVLTEAIIKFRKRFSIPVDMEAPDEVLFSDMEPVLITQVVTNLLENAAYHGISVSRILIRVTAEANDACIEVIDDGVGIPDEQLPDIFKENDVSAKRRGADSRRGMGIGLSVCSSIIKAHGGKMSASNNPAGGATFSFTLPLKEGAYGT